MIIDTQKLKSLHDIKKNKNSNWDECRFNDVDSWLEVIWWLGHDYIKNNPENDQNWDEICTVIHWIDDNLKRSNDCQCAIDGTDICKGNC